ncbi:hypothetical protein VFPFJ_07303 [Purpureocillium lilacinum]|uniref:Uncharacterized protein n=1 Tax=Purpureocillium lilacinum TaxID=33203 RepID=A0A179GPB0_PURLI|nr:hypothetical protein VFPFJ_07303 [Purpureocillium lilacinum]OAQ79757.1 hypothetical protein VFPBJ_05342 [Purpureocillium lilacinum]OAQ88838.1 hypothetical protein VFPFJ_07303 [Purpureocillium lilacinum]
MRGAPVKISLRGPCFLSVLPTYCHPWGSGTDDTAMRREREREVVLVHGYERCRPLIRGRHREMGRRERGVWSREWE